MNPVFAWITEHLDYDEIVKVEEKSIRIQLKSENGKTLIIPFPKKSWIYIDQGNKELYAPLWFCIKTGILEHPIEK